MLKKALAMTGFWVATTQASLAHHSYGDSAIIHEMEHNLINLGLGFGVILMVTAIAGYRRFKS